MYDLVYVPRKFSHIFNIKKIMLHNANLHVQLIFKVDLYQISLLHNSVLQLTKWLCPYMNTPAIDYENYLHVNYTKKLICDRK